MIVLAFDTCFSAVSVALGRSIASGMIIEACQVERRQTGHAERLLPMIRETLARAGVGFGQIDRIAVTLGPGSFTGVRVGVACARALSLSLRVPVVGLTSLQLAALAAVDASREAAAAQVLAVAMDARKGAAYVQRFHDRATRPVGPPALQSLEALAQNCTATQTLVVGSAGPLLSTVSARVPFALADLVPDARQLAALAGILLPLEVVAPLYLRAADARLPGGAALPGAVDAGAG